MRYIKILTVLVWIFSLPFTAVAGTVMDLKEFSIELPDGWEIVGEPKYSTYGVIAIFREADSKAMVLVNMTSSMGKTMSELVAMAESKAKARGAELRVLETTPTKSVYFIKQNGNEMKSITVLDEEKNKYSILTLQGDFALAEKVARTVKTANPKLAFFD